VAYSGDETPVGRVAQALTTLHNDSLTDTKFWSMSNCSVCGILLFQV